MLLDTTRVEEIFALFADLEGDGLRRWHRLCHCAARLIAARTRPEAGEESMEELCVAAAGIAYCDYLMLKPGVPAVRVGDIALGGAPTVADGVALRAQLLARVAHLLVPDCPALIAVGAGDAS